ncbi:MAG TPA: hypothetical protein VFA33_10525 [Bryobacteraceae bacterium]|nr:hypothetical protein [Bryobacteraceae bacterium]
MLKNLLFAFALCGLAIASAKTYTVTLSEPYTLAGKELQPGDYHLSVDGSQAVLKDSQGHVVAAHGTVTQATTKHEYTAVESRSANGGSELRAIELRGTNETVKFN